MPRCRLLIPALPLLALVLTACGGRPSATTSPPAAATSPPPAAAAAPALRAGSRPIPPPQAVAPAQPAEDTTPAVAQETPARVPRRSSATTAPRGGDWPQFRGPGGAAKAAGGAPTTWSATENIVWKTPLPGPGTSSPVLLGNRIFLTGYTGYAVPGQAGGSPEDLQRHVLCLDRASGKILWNAEAPGKGADEASIRENHGYASSTPAADAERVYAFFGRSGVFAFDHNGKRLWQADVGDRTHGWGSAASPVLHGDLVLVNASVESESLVALDRKTGKEVWRAGGIREAWNTPILVSLPGGKTELVIAIFGKILGFDPANGQQLWSCNTDIGWYMAPSMVAQDGVVYCIGGRSGGSLAVRAGGRGDVTATHRLWTGKQGSNVSSPVVAGDYLFWARDSPAIAYCAETKTGKVVYEERMSGAEQVYASSIVAGGHVYHLARNGRMFVLPAKPAHEVVAVNELGERGIFNSSPAAADGRLYLRSERFLYCIGTR